MFRSSYIVSQIFMHNTATGNPRCPLLSVKTRLKAWVTWRVWPDENENVLPLYMVVLYVIGLLTAWECYKSCIEVPIYHEELEIICFDNKFQKTKAGITYRIPHTDNEELIKRNNPDSLLYNVTVVSELIEASQANFCDDNRYCSEFDSLQKSLGDISDGARFYACEISEISIIKQFYDPPKGWRMMYDNHKKPSAFKKLHRNGDKIIIQNYYVAGLKDSTAVTLRTFDTSGITIGKPASYWALKDISQARYMFNLKLEAIDSVYLTIDFLDAVEIYAADPEPDTKTYHSISYHDSAAIAKIKEKGLFVYAHFPQLDNKQASRLFLWTAVMSGIVIILLSFILLGTYKVFILPHGHKDV